MLDSCVGKLIEQLINLRLHENYKVVIVLGFGHHQRAFRPGYGTLPRSYFTRLTTKKDILISYL